MKTITLLLAISLISLTSTHHTWQASGNNIYYNNGKIGVGITDPDRHFEVLHNGDWAVAGFFGDTNPGIQIRIVGDKALQKRNIDNLGLAVVTEPGAWAIGTEYGDAVIRNSSGRKIHFATRLESTISAKMTIDKSGYVGIGTTKPSEKLHIQNGNIFIDNNNGVIMTSPDGTKWKLTIDNSGNISTSKY